MRLRTATPDGPPIGGPGQSAVRSVPSPELDRRIRAGATEWVELQDALLATGGMLPDPRLVARLASFTEDLYWVAEEARVEALRRQWVFDGLGRRDPADSGWELA